MKESWIKQKNIALLSVVHYNLFRSGVIGYAGRPLRTVVVVRYLIQLDQMKLIIVTSFQGFDARNTYISTRSVTFLNLKYGGKLRFMPNSSLIPQFRSRREAEDENTQPTAANKRGIFNIKACRERRIGKCGQHSTAMLSIFLGRLEHPSWEKRTIFCV